MLYFSFVFSIEDLILLVELIELLDNLATDIEEVERIVKGWVLRDVDWIFLVFLEADIDLN